MIKPLLICSIQPPRETKMIIQARQCRMIRVNEKMYELLTLDMDLDVFGRGYKEETLKELGANKVSSIEDVSQVLSASCGRMDEEA